MPGGTPSSPPRWGEAHSKLTRTPARSHQTAVDLLAGDEQLLHRIDADVEVLARDVVELDLDHLLDPAGAEHAGHADIEVVDAILAGQVRRAGQHALLVAQKALGHRDRAGRRGVISAAGLQQSDDLAAAAAGALDDR